MSIHLLAFKVISSPIIEFVRSKYKSFCKKQKIRPISLVQLITKHIKKERKKRKQERKKERKKKRVKKKKI